MIGEQKLKRVQMLLRKNVPKTEIAETVGIARRTVYSIAVGVRMRHVPRSERVRVRQPESAEGRCPGCGHKVQLPCFACETFGPPDNRTLEDGRRL